MTATTHKIAAVAIIGRQDDDEFQPLRKFLQNHPAIRIAGDFEWITDALECGLAQSITTDIAVVLQSTSDQYSREESNCLIGRMLFGRVLCCHGPWCLADGRSHDIWPVATRIALASAEMHVSMELAAFAAGDPPLSPMSAGEEVFVHRIPRTRINGDHRKSEVFVISYERPLRKTIEGMLTDAGLKTRPIPMSVDAVHTAMETSDETPRLAILDLDPLDSMGTTILAELYQAYPHLRVLGMTVFPHAAFSVGPLQAIIDKTELLVQLQWQLNPQMRVEPE